MKNQVPSPDRSSARDDLLKIAVHLFAAGGFAGTSIRDIAGAAGCSVANVYYHFQNKEALWLAVLSGSIGDLPMSLRVAVDACVDPLDRFRRLVRAHVAISHQFPLESQILFIDQGRLSPESNAANRRLQQAVLQIYIDVLRALSDAKLIRSDDLKLMALNVLGVINWHLRWMRPDATVKRRATETDAIVAFVVRAIAA